MDKNKTQQLTKYFFYFLFIIIITLIVIIVDHINTPKLAYVNNKKLLAEFIGVKEFVLESQKQHDILQDNLDTLTKDLSEEINRFNREKSGLSQEELEKRTQLIERKKKNIIDYKNDMEKHTSISENQKAAAVLLQINEFIQDYGEKNGYDYIFGVTDNGSIMYANEMDDLTDVILKELNDFYLDK